MLLSLSDFAYGCIRSGEAVLCILLFFKSLYLKNRETHRHNRRCVFYRGVMKKYRKKIVPDYDSKYSSKEAEYYGVFIEKDKGGIVSVKVDPKRMRKTHLIDNDTYDLIQQSNRNSTYFHPAKRISGEYCFETFRYHINGLRKLWLQEIKPAIDKLKTPKQAGDQVYLSNLSDGIMDVEECNMSRVVASALREPDYRYAIKMFYAQFVLLLGAEVEAMMVNVITKKGYTGEKFSREHLKGYVSGRVPGLDYTLFDNHIFYDKIYKLWNFIKHNNTDVYNKVKDVYPELLYNPNANYVNGDIAIKYLNLTEEMIMDLLDGVIKFFDEFCVKVFGETIDYAEWNTEEYYVQLAKDKIEDIDNPLGLPWYI